MVIKITHGPVAEMEADVLVIPAFESEGEAPPEPFKSLYESGEFAGKPLETAVLHNAPGFRAKRLVAAGGGLKSKFNAAEMRKAVGAVTRTLKEKRLRNITLALNEPCLSAVMVAAAVEGALLGDYEPDHLKTDTTKSERRLESFTVRVPKQDKALEEAVERGRILAEAQNFARDLVNEPANILTPMALAAHARQMAADCGLECEVLEQDRMQQLGMGSLLGVAQGSAEPPALIIIRYKPESGASQDHLGLVGKGVTFDTGGVSIKPSDGMEKMKYDMAGGAAVLGAMRAISKLKPQVQVTALVPTVENMVSSRAQRPGDIVKSLSGKTVEVLNTDAEGRLILIDAITYAIRLGCTHLVDAATLTGAIVVALGHIHIGAFTSDEDFLKKVMTAAGAEGERMWHMPLDDDYKEYLKSAFADLPNIGGRWGGAITAAMFLKEFTEGKPWVHLDIAGTAWLDDGKPYLAKGPSGVAVRTFTNLAMNW
ncbi:MAG TPA: leucyl aminopeptidase [Bryobacteraceae bacterium]|nr:leucyl aminopeptidase [Bryobacteraceae bacterium]